MYVANVMDPRGITTVALVEEPLCSTRRSRKNSTEFTAEPEVEVTFQDTDVHSLPAFPVDNVGSMRKLLHGLTLPDTVTMGTGTAGVRAARMLAVWAVLFVNKGQSAGSKRDAQLAVSLLSNNVKVSPGITVEVEDRLMRTVVVFRQMHVDSLIDVETEKNLLQSHDSISPSPPSFVAVLKTTNRYKPESEKITCEITGAGIVETE